MPLLLKSLLRQERGVYLRDSKAYKRDICHNSLGCCTLSTERQNIQFNYNCCNEIQVDLVSPT